MGWLDVKPVIVLNSGGWPAVKKPKKVAGIMSADEIDRLVPDSLSGVSREGLAVLRKKLRLTMDELYPDCDPGDPAWDLWERRMDRLDAMVDRIDEILEDEDFDIDQEDR